MSKHQSDNVLKLKSLAREALDSVHEEDEITLVEVPPGSPMAVKATLPMVLAVPPSHRAILIVALAALVAGVISFLISLGHVPSWLG